MGQTPWSAAGPLASLLGFTPSQYVLYLLLAATAMAQQQPVEQVWIKSAPSPNAAVARIRPDVHSVEIGEHEVTVRSAGISLDYLGPLELSPLPRTDVREFVFKIPRSPATETNRHAHVPLDYIGVFVNGVPIPNHFEAASYQGQNLWHYDLVAR